MQTEFICPDGAKVSKSKCLMGKCRMAERCAPLSYLQLAGREREWKGVPSVTQLISGTRCEYLKLTTGYAVDPAKAAFRVHGTRGHTALDSNNNSSFTEEHFEDEGIQGTADMFEQQADGTWWLIDHKTAGSFKVAKALGLVKKEEVQYDEISGIPLKHKNGKPVKKTWFEASGQPDIEDWMLQLNKYRMMGEKALGEKISRIKIFAVVRDGNTFTAKNRGVMKEIYYIDIPMMLDGAVNMYFDKKKDLLLSALKDGTMPEECSASECWSGNKCKICDVADACKAAGRTWIVEGEDE